MKICFVAPADNYHTKKWCKWFITQGHTVHVISFVHGDIDGAIVHYVETGAKTDSNDSKKLSYLFKAKKVKKIIDEINPDIVNAHYVSSYGAVVALSGVKNYIVSMWGSDVYEFPQKSVLHRALVSFSLMRATYLFSTSYAMANEAKKYTSKDITITPFGVDMQLFRPIQSTHSDFVVGTIKSLTPKYGIDTLIQAVAKVKQIRPDIPIRLHIAGKGNYEEEYRNLAYKLGINDITKWLGFIDQESVAREWNNMDIAIVASTAQSETFGVSAVEASACSRPVIITDIEGLKETTVPGKTSIVVPVKDHEVLAEKIIYLYDNPKVREKLGQEGRKFVEEHFELNNCFKTIENKFNEISIISKNS